MIPSVILEQNRADITSAYIAEGIRICGENLSRAFGGSYMQKRLSEVLDPVPEDKRSGDEIADYIMKRLTE